MKALMSSVSLKAHYGCVRDHRNPRCCMAYLHRLIALLLLLGFLSSAGAVTVQQTGSWTSDRPGLSTVFPDSGTCLTASKSNWDAANSGSVSCRVWTTGGFFVAGSSLKIGANLSGCAGGGVVCTATPWACPANSTKVGATCVCDAGKEASSDGKSCVAPDPDVTACAGLAGKDAGPKNWEGQASTFSFCDAYATAGGLSVGGGKCVATASKDIAWESPPGSGHWISQGAATYTGVKAVSCNGTGGTGGDPAGSTPPGADGKPPAEPAPGQAAPSPCPKGQAPGEVNGTRVCAPVGPDVQATDKKEQQNPDGSKQVENGTTKCVDGKCTTVKETCTTPSGSTTATCGTTTTTQGQGVFCAANKGSNACTGDGDGTGSSFGGDCAAGFKAEGDDPVINAMALEQHKRNCEIFYKTTPESELYVVEKAKTGNQTTGNPNNSTVGISSSDFDQSDALGGAACLGDRSFFVAGQTVVLTFSKICPYADMLGQILVAIAFLTAAGIVYGKVR